MSAAPGLIMAASPSAHVDWKHTPAQRLLLLLVLGLAIAAFWPGLEFMVATWQMVEEFSYGWFVPPIVVFLIWQRSDLLRALPLQGSWSGLGLVLAGLLLGILGQASAIRSFSQYGFVVTVMGLAACVVGWRGMRLLAPPLSLLFLMVPLPQFVLLELSQQLQLLSSQIGVAFIRAMDISVHLEGNVIDLGSYQLQVADACSGLRYLFPLVVLAVLATFFFDAPLWQRVLLVLSAPPLAILTNSLRIGAIGVTVEHWGPDMAEGLLHDFEGWFVFMVCLVALAAEMVLLARWTRPGRPWSELFRLELPDPAAPGARWQLRRWPLPLAAAGVPLLVTALVVAGWQIKGQAPQELPPRLALDGLLDRPPEGYTTRPLRVPQLVLATLAVDDHLLADYSLAGQAPINLFIAYYGSQSGGQSSHSPRTCIPGDGWRVSQLGLAQAGQGPAQPVNRAVIEKGEQQQLVYYWFQQRGRLLTGELSVKWYILRDSIATGRSDGAMVRLVTAVSPTESLADADARLGAFMTRLQSRLPAHLPP